MCRLFFTSSKSTINTNGYSFLTLLYIIYIVKGKTEIQFKIKSIQK